MCKQTGFGAVLLLPVPWHKFLNWFVGVDMGFVEVSVSCSLYGKIWRKFAVNFAFCLGLQWR